MHVLRGATQQPRHRRTLLPLAITTSLALVLAACGGGGRDGDDTATPTDGNGDAAAEPSIDTSACTTPPDTEIEGDTIKLGTSLPQSGLYSAFTEILRGEKSYFDYVNSQGGVEI